MSSKPQTPPTGCSAQNCALPKCSCLGAIPEIDVSKAPMMVLLGFDDAITQAFRVSYYQDLLVDNKFLLHNPNKCPIRATFFVSSANTDFSVVQTLNAQGHEFASHTIHHILVDGGTEKQFKDEIVGMRELLVNNSQLDADQVVGFKAPYLKLAGDQMFQVLQDSGFLYDASISNIESKKGNSHLWPFTLDFPIPESMCPNGPCPKKGFPGLWEIPLNIFQTRDEGHCAMIDACVVANTTDEEDVVRDKYLQYFQSNFYQHFYPKKIPMHLFTHSAIFLRNNGSFPALIDFLQEITKLPDVWLVTPMQVIAWMRNPVSNSDAKDGRLPSWRCQAGQN